MLETEEHVMPSRKRADDRFSYVESERSIKVFKGEYRTVRGQSYGWCCMVAANVKETWLRQGSQMGRLEPRRKCLGKIPASDLSACLSYVATRHQPSAPFIARSHPQHTATG